jgi:signal transduction histidine kinase
VKDGAVAASRDAQTGAVAHDLRNLLCLIHAGVEVVEQWARAHAPPEVLAALGDMRLASADSVALISQLLEPATGEVEVLATLDPVALIDDLRSIVERTVGPHVHVEVDARSTAPLTVNRRALHRVLLNLCTNARDAMPAGGTLTITSRDRRIDLALARALGLPGDGPYVELAVADTGCGMPPDVVARMFEPFFTTKAAQGTGLGLASSATIVRMHGGHIAADSQPGRGTTIRILLPALAP